MAKAAMEPVIREKLLALAPVLNERTRRLWAATAATALGHRGPTRVARAPGRARRTLPLGRRALEPGAHRPVALRPGVRRPGGGRTALTAPEPTRVTAVAALGEPTRRGDPPGPWRWTCTSVRP